MKYLKNTPQRAKLGKPQEYLIKMMNKKHNVSSHYELYLKYFLEELNLQNKKIAVCDIGGGDGWALSYSNKNITKYVIDVDNEYKNELKKKNITFIKAKLGQGEHKSKNSFDVILLNHVIEHIYEYEQAVSEIYDMLKPGGFVIVRCPNILHKSIRFNFWNDYTHVKPYTPRSLEVAFKSAGFETHTITTFSYNKFMLGFLFSRKMQKRIYKYGPELLYIGKKK